MFFNYVNTSESCQKNDGNYMRILRPTMIYYNSYWFFENQAMQCIFYSVVYVSWMDNEYVALCTADSICFLQWLCTNGTGAAKRLVGDHMAIGKSQISAHQRAR